MLSFQQNLKLQMIKRITFISLLFILACTKGELPEPKNIDTWEPIIGYNTPNEVSKQLTYNFLVDVIGKPPPFNYTPPPAGHHNGYSFGLFGWVNLAFSGVYSNGWTGFDSSQQGHLLRLRQPLVDGTDITITAIPGDGYKFSEWSNGQTANPITFKLNSNVVLTAIFIKID